MQSGCIISAIVICSILIAGCIQLPGMHILSNTPDPIIGQWIGGELPATDRHIIFYENQTFFSTNFFLNRGETTDTGNWTKKEPGLYSIQSGTTDIKGKPRTLIVSLMNYNPLFVYFRFFEPETYFSARTGIITVVIPLYCKRRCIANAVSLCSIFWNGFS
jgi:hypothetical protein